MTLNQSCTKDALYLLVKIKDDVLIDHNVDPITAWWDDDCLKIFGALLLEE